MRLGLRLCFTRMRGSFINDINRSFWHITLTNIAISHINGIINDFITDRHAMMLLVVRLQTQIAAVSLRWSLTYQGIGAQVRCLFSICLRYSSSVVAPIREFATGKRWLPAHVRCIEGTLAYPHQRDAAHRQII